MAFRRILVVDDEADIREVAQMSLETTAGWDVVGAASGEEALTLARTEEIDAVLLDVMMPGMDGLATYQQLRSDPATRSLPVILLTAKVLAADKERFENMGVLGMIAKPFDPLKLAELMAGFLGWQI